MSIAKLDTKQASSLDRLRNNQDFQSFRAHMQARLDGVKRLLVTAQPQHVSELQGRARELIELLDL